MKRAGVVTRGITQIAAGAGAAQLLALVSLPLLTRIYSPDAFGVFAYITAICSILIPIASLRLELVVPLPTIQKDSEIALRIGIVISMIFSAVTAIGVWLVGGRLDDGNDLELMPWLWFLPILVLLGAWFTLLSQMAITHKDYKAVAVRNFSQGIGTVVGQFIFSLATRTGGGLLAGSVVGRCVGIGSLARKYRHALVVSNPLRGGKELLSRYKHFPLVFTSSAILNTLGTALPLLLFGFWYGAVAAGFLGVAQRVLAAPAALVSGSVSQVFLGELADRVRNGQRENMRLYLKATTRLAALGILIPLITIPLAPVLTPMILGNEWADAGAYAQAVSVVAGVSFVVSPLTIVFTVYETPFVNLFLDVFRVAIVAIAGVATWSSGWQPLHVLWILVVAQVVTYTITWFVGMEVVRRGSMVTNPLR